jgi:hypothetical protein
MGLLILIFLLLLSPVILIIIGAVMKASTREETVASGKTVLKVGLILLCIELALLLIGFAICTGMMH